MSESDRLQVLQPEEGNTVARVKDQFVEYSCFRPGSSKTYAEMAQGSARRARSCARRAAACPWIWRSRLLRAGFN